MSVSSDILHSARMHTRRGAANLERRPLDAGATVFVRFVIAERDKRSDQGLGVFTALYRLEREGKLAPHESQWFRLIEAWFDEHLQKPARLTWSNRPHAPARAITWLKMSATEHVTRIRELVTLLEYKDVPVQEMRTSKPGYVVYEDEHQVAAIPFEGETFGST